MSRLDMIAYIVGLWCLCAVHVKGHGRLVEPPNRSSLWRFGYGTPANYDDNGLNCGGFYQQWSVNGGKCGVCGDPYNGARQHEDGGQYASGIITGNYEEGQVIKTQVLITANHLGWFEFRVCPLQQVSDYKSVQQCLDENVLELADGTGVRYDLSTQRGDVTVELFLPSGVVCKHCLLQWKWHCGNNWGTSAGGVGCMGCGAQEEFYGCADVTIQPRGGWHNTSSTPPASTAPSTRKPSTTDPSPPLTVVPHKQVCKATGAWAGQLAIDMWCESNCAKGFCPPSHCACLRVEEVSSSTQTVTDPSSTTLSTTPTGQKKCAATGDWLGDNRMDEWCVANCASGYCPATHCACVTNPSTSSAASTSTPSPFSTQSTTPNRTVNASATTTSAVTATASPQNVTTTSSNITHYSLNVTTTPYKVTETPQNATTSPYDVTENPQSTTSASQNVTGNSPNATTMSHNVTKNTQNVTRTPQNTTTTPYNVTEISQIATTMSYNVTETLKNATSTSYNVTDTPQIATSTPYGTAGNATSTRHTVTQVPQSATTSALNSCAVYKSINGTGGSFFDSYCHITCSLSIADCPLDSCTCADNGDATPPTTSCRPLDEFADLPYFDQFCSLMCVADACDDEYCSCK